MPGDVTVVIRTCGERTLDLCKQIIVDQVGESSVVVVNEQPFEKALDATYRKGLERGAKWTVALDADVLLIGSAVMVLLELVEGMHPDVCHVNVQLRDKFTGFIRQGCPRVYRTNVLEEAIDILKSGERFVRPETMVVDGLKARGYGHQHVKQVLGVHDYEQWLVDVYRKTFVYARKFRSKIGDIVQQCALHLESDQDYAVALRGVYDGLLYTGPVVIDSREYTARAVNAMSELGFTEKPPLYAVCGNRVVEEIFAAVHEPSAFDKSAEHSRFPEEARCRGISRRGVWLLGRILSKAGNKLDRLSQC